MCAFFHIPFQSGDNDVLRAMRRGYTHARYRNIVDNIRRHMPDASISGDAIVGFPGDLSDLSAWIAWHWLALGHLPSVSRHALHLPGSASSRACMCADGALIQTSFLSTKVQHAGHAA